MVLTGTTNRSPSTEASSPPPHACASSMRPWASISAALAAAWCLRAQVVLVHVRQAGPGSTPARRAWSPGSARHCRPPPPAAPPRSPRGPSIRGGPSARWVRRPGTRSRRAPPTAGRAGRRGAASPPQPPAARPGLRVRRARRAGPRLSRARPFALGNDDATPARPRRPRRGGRRSASTPRPASDQLGPGAAPGPFRLRPASTSSRTASHRVPVEQPGPRVGPPMRGPGEHVAPPQCPVQRSSTHTTYASRSTAPGGSRRWRTPLAATRRHQLGVDLRGGSGCSFTRRRASVGQPADRGQHPLAARRRVQARPTRPAAPGTGAPCCSAGPERAHRRARPSRHRRVPVLPPKRSRRPRRRVTRYAPPPPTAWQPQGRSPETSAAARAVKQHPARAGDRLGRLLQPRQHRQPLLGRRPPSRAEQPGRHQQREQVQRVIDRGRLQVAHHRDQRRGPLRLPGPRQRRGLAPSRYGPAPAAD